MLSNVIPGPPAHPVHRLTFSGNRCGLGCGSTTISAAVIYFPPGTYLISSPIIQFSGIALFDTDVYIPGGNCSEWFINQNQFYRQIRNFNFDLTEMPNQNQQGDQTSVPTGIHWQVARSTSLQNLHFTMPQGDGPTAVGVFTENGSGGFMSDPTFLGGNIGMWFGSQQFTARDITFTNPAIAVSMIWDWGWKWKNIEVNAALVAFQLTNFGGIGLQDTGSLTNMDSYVGVPFGIPVSPIFTPSIVIDNVLVEGNSPQIVFVDGTTDNLLGGTSGGSTTISSWATVTDIPRPPQYEDIDVSPFLNVLDHGVTGDGSTDDGPALNSLLSQCVSSICFIPFGIYQTSVTLEIPVGARIVGEAWPQLVGFGDLFSDSSNPAPVFRVGQAGDSGVVEISDVLFSTAQTTPGAVVVEWNVHESSQGSGATWDSHFRLGGAFNTGITGGNCGASASLLLHVTPQASGYFENFWLWTADHYLDDVSQVQINSSRPSQGPSWFWSGAVEHSVLYEYNVQGASNVPFEHMQTESPYFQPAISANSVFPSNFEGDPDFADCSSSDPTCTMAWALYIANPTDIFVYGGGFYSFFDTYSQVASNCVQVGNPGVSNCLVVSMKLFANIRKMTVQNDLGAGFLDIQLNVYYYSTSLLTTFTECSYNSIEII
ncbi:pectate lyase superfamily protein-domain-containing protein [Xylogone sp. PMI_703]|nr:pectate lyase superfamily protein-domain-containing protein [Xylogone sp. PMI_703]